MSAAGLTFLKNTQEDEPSTSALGTEGERLAAEYLRRRGFEMVCRNFTAPVGRNRNGAQVTGEIDLIALDGGTVCFIEVKTRTDPVFAAPLTAVDRKKQRQIARTAKVYRRLFGLETVGYRFDAVGVSILPGRPPLIDHRKSFWTESGLRRRNRT